MGYHDVSFDSSYKAAYDFVADARNTVASLQRLKRIQLSCTCYFQLKHIEPTA